MIYRFFIISLLLITSACTTNKAIISSAGTVGPGLPAPLPKTQRILIISTLTATQINIISENIFQFQNLGSDTISAPTMNRELATTMQNTVKKLGYLNTTTMEMNQKNILNTEDVQSSAEAISFLKSITNPTKADTIILLTLNDGQPFDLDIKCELGKNNIYRHATIQSHLYLYKIYILDTHTWKIISWITGSPTANLYNLTLCMPPSSLSPEQRLDLENLTLQELKKAVHMDLYSTLTGAKKSQLF